VSVLVYGVPEDCPPNNFEVAADDDTVAFVDDVAFTLIVP
jgi:hypothetical protein